MSADQPAASSGEPGDESRRPPRDRPAEKTPGTGASADRTSADHAAGGSRSRAEYAADVRAAGWQGREQRPPAGSGDQAGRSPAAPSGRPDQPREQQPPGRPGDSGPAREQPARSPDRGASGAADPESPARPAPEPGTGHRDAGSSALAPRHDSPAGEAPGRAGRADYADGLRMRAPSQGDSPPAREQAPDTAGGPAHPGGTESSPARPGDPADRDAARPGQGRPAEHAPAGTEGRPAADLSPGPAGYPGDENPGAASAAHDAAETIPDGDSSHFPRTDAGDAAGPPRPERQDGGPADGSAAAAGPQPAGLADAADRMEPAGDQSLAGTSDRHPAAGGARAAAPESGPGGSAADGGRLPDGAAGQDRAAAAAEHPAGGDESWPPPQADRDRARAAYQEYLKAAAADPGREAGTNVVGEKPDRSPGDGRDLPPTGEQILGMENDRASRGERFRDRILEESGDLADSAKDVTESVRSILERPPPGGHPVVQAPDRHQGPSDVPQHAQVSAGSVVETAFVVGIVALKATSRLWHKHPEMGK